MARGSGMVLVVRRALSNPAPVASVAINVLVVCTLVSGLAASLTLLQAEALHSSLALAAPDDTVLAVTSPYDDESAVAQDRAVRAALTPLVDVVGGDVVVLNESGTYDVAADPDAAAAAEGVAFASIDGADGHLSAVDGALPAAGPGPLEVAAPVGSGLAVGDEVTLVSRTDDRRVPAAVVGTWEPTPGSDRWLGGLDPGVLLVDSARFGDVAGVGTLSRWRAVPDLEALGPDQLATLSSAVGTTTREADAAGEEVGSSVQIDTGLVEVLEARAGELTVLRALLLVPAGLLMLVAAAGLVLVASGLAGVRRDEESLLRSRGAAYRQLAGPTIAETLVVCGAAALIAPPIASSVVRIGDVRPPLDGAAWLGSGIAAAACAVALSIPVVVRALTGDRGEQLAVEKQRRRVLTLLLTTVVVVAGLGALAVVTLRGFGDTVGSATATSSSVDPLLVASPALLLLAAAVIASLLVLPPVFQLLARLAGSRGVPLALGTRFAARAPATAVPLALATTLAVGTLAFAAVERSSSAAARDDRADFVAGADVRVTTPSPALRAGAAEERAELMALPGVESVRGVHRADTFLEDLPAEVIVTEVSAAAAVDLFGPEPVDTSGLAAAPWADDTIGVALPAGTRRLAVTLADAGWERADLVLVDADGAVSVVVAEVEGDTASARLGAVPDDSRLVGVRSDATRPDERGARPQAEVVADDEVLAAGASWWDAGGPQLVVFGAEPTLPVVVPVALSEDLAEAASLSVGDTVTLSVLGLPTQLEVVATIPYVRTVSDGDGAILLDGASVLPTLVAAGFSDEPDEWWLDVAPGAGDDVTAALAQRADIAREVVTAEGVARQLDTDPSTGGAALGQVLVLTGAGCLVVGGLLLFSVVLLRRRERAEQAWMLGTAGADRRDLLGVLTWEYVVVVGAGVVTGILAGTAVAAVTLVSMTLGPDGQLLVPAPELVLPWPVLVSAPVAMALVPLLAMVSLTRRDHQRTLDADEIGRGRR
ncbi:MAG: FtsX-like permease family protein [Nocardioides sp.]